MGRGSKKIQGWVEKYDVEGREGLKGIITVPFTYLLFLNSFFILIVGVTKLNHRIGLEYYNIPPVPEWCKLLIH